MSALPASSTSAPYADGMPLEEYLRRFAEHPIELIDGALHLVSPTLSYHTLLAKRISRLIDEAVGSLGETFSEAAFVLSDAPDWVKGSRLPDLMFVSAARLAAFKQTYPDWKTRPFILIPELVVEIVSPTDRPGPVLSKVARYLEDGVQIIWVLYPERATVVIYRADGTPVQTLGSADMLTAAPILPNLKLSIQRIFE